MDSAHLNDHREQVCVVTRILALVAISFLLIDSDAVSQDLMPSHTIANSEPRLVQPMDLLELRDMGGYHGALAVSNDGKQVAFRVIRARLETNDYQTNWFVASTVVKGNAKDVGDGGQPILRPHLDGRINGAFPPTAPVWSRDGKWILYLKEKDNSIQLWRSRTDGGKQQQLTNNSADVYKFSFSPTGDKIFFWVGRDRLAHTRRKIEEAKTGYLLDQRFLPPYSDAPIYPACTADDWFKDVVQRSGLDICQPTLWVYDLNRHEERHASVDETNEYEKYSEVRLPSSISRRSPANSVTYAKDGEKVAWLENSKPETFKGIMPPLSLYAYLPSADPSIVKCPDEVCHGQLKGVWWWGDKIIFMRREGHAFSQTALYAWQPRAKTLRHILKTDALIADCELGQNGLVCLHEAPTQPREIVNIDLASGELSTIFDPNSHFKDIHFTTVEKLEWINEFGDETFGHLVYPVDYVPGNRYPLVIVQYTSEGFLRGGVGDEYPIHVLAANGFAVLSFDTPKLWDLRTKLPRPARQSAYWRNYRQQRGVLSSLELILHDLERRNIIDPSRVGGTGLSGGVDNLSFALIHADLFAAVSMSGKTWTPISYLLSPPWLQELARKRGFGYPGSDEDLYWSGMSVALQPGKVEAPILIQSSSREYIYDMHLVSSLRHNDRPVELFVFPDEYHIKRQPQHRLAIYRRNVQWFRFWLMGEEDPLPIDREQYKRWRKMRDERCAWEEPEDEKPSYCEYSNTVH